MNLALIKWFFLAANYCKAPSSQIMKLSIPLFSTVLIVSLLNNCNAVTDYVAPNCRSILNASCRGPGLRAWKPEWSICCHSDNGRWAWATCNQITGRMVVFLCPDNMPTCFHRTCGCGKISPFTMCSSMDQDHPVDDAPILPGGP